jgi:uncharacterized protein YcfJ
MHALSKFSVALAGVALAASACAQITFYENEGFQGRSFNTSRTVPDFQRSGFNDRASSVVVTSNRWEVCQDVAFKGRCVVLRPGQYPSLAAMGLNDRVSSVRTVGRNARVDDERYAPPPVVDRDYRRRQNERLFEVPVTSVRAVIGTPERRCWVEREQVPQDRSDARVPSAILGAVIGGILGHQIGGGTGRDVATVGGAVAGAAVGANIARDRDGRQIVTRDVQRCTSVPSQAHPDYWDVTYTFRGVEHRVQMATPPGPTVTVNRQGEPRV